MEGWRTTRIGELGKIVTGKTPPTNISDVFGDSIPFITPRDMLGSRFIDVTERYLTKKGGDILSRYFLPKNSILVSCIGSDMGNVAISKNESVTNQQLNAIIVKEEISWLYIYYNLLPRKQELKNRAGGSAQPILNKSSFCNIEILLPSFIEQQAIAHILGTLDDKIELNRRQNATLEAMAQAIFKDWFVDFGPVRAKMEGRQPEGMSREIVDLFPDRLDGEGKPEGWKKLTIGDVFKIVGGSTPSTKEENFWKGGVHCWTTPKDISRLKAPILLETERHITDEGVSIISSGLLPVGTLLLSSRAPIGYLAITKVNTAINQGFIAVYENKEISSSYMLLWCKAHMNDIFEKANGSTFQEISKSNFRTISFIFPDDKILSIGNKYINSIYEKITFNEMEINTLTSLRDSLLPKLISGELRVPDAEKMVADIV